MFAKMGSHLFSSGSIENRFKLVFIRLHHKQFLAKFWKNLKKQKNMFLNAPLKTSINLCFWARLGEKMRKTGWELFLFSLSAL